MDFVVIADSRCPESYLKIKRHTWLASFWIAYSKNLNIILCWKISIVFLFFLLLDDVFFRNKAFDFFLVKETTLLIQEHSKLPKLL